MTSFDPAQVPINYTLNFQQVNLILEGLGTLPFAKVEQLYNGLRSVALQTLQAAEKDAADKAASKDQPDEVTDWAAA